MYEGGNPIYCVGLHRDCIELRILRLVTDRFHKGPLHQRSAIAKRSLGVDKSVFGWKEKVHCGPIRFKSIQSDAVNRVTVNEVVWGDQQSKENII
jgi:hypothetical protein